MEDEPCCSFGVNHVRFPHFPCQCALLYTKVPLCFLFSAMVSSLCFCPSLHPLTLAGLSLNSASYLWPHRAQHLVPSVPSLPFPELLVVLRDSSDLPSPVGSPCCPPSCPLVTWSHLPANSWGSCGHPAVRVLCNLPKPAMQWLSPEKPHRKPWVLSDSAGGGARHSHRPGAMGRLQCTGDR